MADVSWEQAARNRQWLWGEICKSRPYLKPFAAEICEGSGYMVFGSAFEKFAASMSQLEPGLVVPVDICTGEKLNDPGFASFLRGRAWHNRGTLWCIEDNLSHERRGPYGFPIAFRKWLREHIQDAPLIAIGCPGTDGWDGISDIVKCLQQPVLSILIIASPGVQPIWDKFVSAALRTSKQTRLTRQSENFNAAHPDATR